VDPRDTVDGGSSKIHLEELFWVLEDEPSELAKMAKFMSGLLPSLNTKLCSKEYSSSAHATEAALIEEQRLGEAGRCMHGEDWEQKKQHGRGRERSREPLWTKWQAKKEQANSKEQEQESPEEYSKPMVQCLEGCWQCSKEGHIESECPEQRREAEFLWRVNNDNKRQHHCFVQDYTAVVKPLTLLTSPKVKWNNAQQDVTNF